MKILVTGANGYLGTGIVKSLLNDGAEVIATDLATNRIDKKAICIESDLFKVDKPYKYFGEPDVLLHLAWRDGFQHNSENHLGDLNNHFTFIKTMMDAGLKRVAVLGSMHEIGFYEGSINEQTPCNPLSLYGISKNALRQAVMLEAKNAGSVVQWIRGYYIVGNVESGCSIFSKIVQSAREGKKEFPFTMGVKQYDFLDYDTFCSQVAAVVEQDAINGIINCCAGVPMRLGERVEQFIKENDLKIKLLYGAFPDRPYDSKAVWGDNKKIQEIMKEHKTLRQCAKNKAVIDYGHQE